MMTEHVTSQDFIGWYSTKDGFHDEFASKFHHLLKTRSFEHEELRMDNAGENTSFYKMITGPDWKIVINARYTPRNTPPHFIMEILA